MLLHEPARPLDSHQRDLLKASFSHLVYEFLRRCIYAVVNHWGKLNWIGISVLAICQVAFCDGTKERVTEPSAP